jgi:hypothetical protein
MSVFKDIEQLLNPGFLTSFRENMPPVQCIIWKGGEVYQTIRFDTMFPFDQLDDIKRMICTSFPGNSNFHPKFMFVGIPLGDESESGANPTLESQYIPLDYLWYPQGSEMASRDIFILRSPRRSLIRPDSRFSTPDGTFPPVNLSQRGRSTIEASLLKVRNNRMPVLHVYLLHDLIESYRGVKPVSEGDWNQRFKPYFPDISSMGPHKPSAEDIAYLKTIQTFTKRREGSLQRVNRLLSEGAAIPEINITGVRMLRLILQKPQAAFEGCESLFYRIRTTEQRPFTRLMPSEGSAITKVYVRGALPIPALEDPQVLLQWAKETSPEPGKNFMYLKYVHRKAIGALPPIYGTIRVYDEGTADIILQPPKQVRKLDPERDFSKFSSILETAMIDMPQNINQFQLGEAFLLFSLKTELRTPKFTRSRLRSRLPFFQAFFHEIKPLPGHSPVLSIRYKCVPEFATEDKFFTFISQYMTQSVITGEESLTKMLEMFQMEFNVSNQQAREIYHKWVEQKGNFAVTAPEEDEFMEKFNPGIDIHIFEQHPHYHFQVNRIDSYDTFERIYTLVGLLFLEDDSIFKTSAVAETAFATEARNVESRSLSEEGEFERSESSNEGEEDEEVTGVSLPAYMMGDLSDNNDEDESGEALLPEKAPPTTAPTAAAPLPAVVPPPALGAIKAAEDEKTVDPKSWFINKLQELDDRLFKKGAYSRACAANEDRQPAILSKPLFDRMMEEYEPDVESGQIFFRVLPLEGDDDQDAPPSVPADEIYTIMKFGTDPADPKYYFCPEFYCLADEIMIRKRDFEASVDREGRRKPKNSCPFCYGLLITDKNKAIRNHTVYRRKVKKGSKDNSIHGYVGFVKAGTTGHPEGFAYPCCHTKPKTLRITDPAFAHFRRAQEELADEDEDETNETSTVIDPGEAIEYGFIFQRMASTYILGPLRRPLEAGKVGAVPTEFDRFFHQDTEKIIKRTGSRQDLRPKSHGFLRIGTDNSSINDALLGLLAPIILKNTISEVKERIIEAVNPRVFVAANFGNFVHEFYDPTQGRKPTQSELSLWASSHLNVRMGTNEFQIQRIYNAYNNFIGFIRSSDTRKELRHITPLLAEGVLTIEPRGVNLLVVDWDIENKDTPLSIRCPPYGVSVERHKKNDIVFVSRDELGRYELFIYTKNEPGKGESPPIHDYTVRWMNATRETWPKIVTERVDEFYNKCQSRYRSVYTSETGINPHSLLGLSEAVRFFKRPVGLVRDMYNHAVGILLQPQTPGVSGLVAIPVVDDGYMAVGLDLVLDWTAYQPAPADEIVKFYNEVAGPLMRLYKGYKIVEIDTSNETNTVVALKLANGIHIPASPPLAEDGVAGLEKETIEELEWAMDKDIFTQDCGSVEEALSRKTNLKQVEELYQHFRISFANWLSTPEAGGQLRKTVEQVVFSNTLPDYEKRKRLEILLLSTLKTWFYLDPEEWEMPMTFMRKDCIIVDAESACTGTCKWVAEEAGPGPRCKIHVNATTSLGLNKDKTSEREVNTALLYSKRLIDELVRFTKKRKQHLYIPTSKVSSVTEPFRIGNQYIIPESSPTWLNMLRLEWAMKVPERPKFFEEMSALQPLAEGAEGEVEGAEDLKPLPDNLKRLLGDTSLHLWLPTVGEAEPLMTLSPIFGVSLSEIGVDSTATSFTRLQLEKLSLATRKTYGIINLREEPPQVYFVGRDKQETDPIIILVYLPDNSIAVLIEDVGLAYMKDIPERLMKMYTERIRAKSGGPAKRTLRLKIPMKEAQTVEEAREAAKPSAPVEDVAPTKKISFRRVVKPVTSQVGMPPSMAPVVQPTTLPVVKEEPKEKLPVVTAPSFAKSEENQESAKSTEESLSSSTTSPSPTPAPVSESPEQAVALPAPAPVSESPAESVASSASASVSESPEQAVALPAPVPATTVESEVEESEESENSSSESSENNNSSSNKKVRTLRMAAPAPVAKPVVSVKPSVAAAAPKPVASVKPSVPAPAAKPVVSVKPSVKAAPAPAPTPSENYMAGLEEYL